MSKKTPKYYFSKTWLMNFDFFIGWSWHKFCEYAHKNHGCLIPEYSGQTGYTTMITNQQGGARVMIWLKDNKSPAIAAHEALHAVNFTFDRAGFKLCTNNDEAQAYFLTEVMTAMGYK